MPSRSQKYSPQLAKCHSSRQLGMADSGYRRLKISMLHLRHVKVLRYLKMSSPFNLFYQKSFLFGIHRLLYPKNFGMQELMTPNETVLVLAYRERTPADRIYLEERVYHFEIFELDSTGGDKGMKINSTGMCEGHNKFGSPSHFDS